MDNLSSQKPLTSRQGQEIFARLAKLIVAELEKATSSSQPEDARADALHRLEAVGAALADPKT